MPAVPSRNRFANRNISDCARDGLMMVMLCNGCRRRVNYWAKDLLLVLDPYHEAHVPPWKCGRCKTIEHMQMRWKLPYPDELAKGLTVRRPVKKIERWIWRDERA